MNRLILLRHAKAETEAASGDDFDRPLAPRGRREAKAMGARLAALGFKADMALVSPALRTRETFEIAAESLAAGEVRFDPALYNAEAKTIRRLAEIAGTGGGTVLVVAHNPGLQELTVSLMRDGAAPASFLARALRDFPPAAVAVFDIDAAGRAIADGLFYPEREA
ncbi:histidine phosphatase family protein [Phenylobacterium sp. LjRoot219]|uniref:SixA phosphatase family protein n=1 Tax=Phenylobacterium sp. LjRoot219 TaxID=3342283 RepID=UPI003ECD6CE7